MTSEPSAVQRRHFLHTAATTLSWHSGSTTASNWQPFTFTQDGVEHAYGETVLFRTEGSAGNVLAVGLWRARGRAVARRGRHHADLHLRGRRRNLSGPERSRRKLGVVAARSEQGDAACGALGSR